LSEEIIESVSNRRGFILGSFSSFTSELNAVSNPVLLRKSFSKCSAFNSPVYILIIWEDFEP
jgi:hypothetical protein